MKKERKHGCGNMTAEEWFEIEENSYGDKDLTMEEIAAMGPSGRKLYRESSWNPNYLKPDRSLFDESLYDGTKIKSHASDKTNKRY